MSERRAESTREPDAPAGRGLFVTFEGGDGSGKTTQVDLLKQWLEARGHSVRTTREPGGTELGRQIRQLLLHGGDVAPRAEALLYAADRAHHVATLIRPALERGEVVIADRYIDSSIAYQGAARSLGKDEIRELSLWATGGLMPDVTVLLDLPVGEAGARLGASQDRIESAGQAFHEAVRREYLELARLDPGRWLVVDARAGAQEIAGRVREFVGHRLGRR
ncbi:MAG: dTMP kinase [Actinomycetaceae bacterium]|nr:dTMP kinase [Actinomycetaceae bacterium]